MGILQRYSRALQRYAVILITGATGLIGGEVALALADEGRPVRALVRARSAEHARERLLVRLEKSDAYRPDLADLIEAVPGDTTLEMLGAAPDAFAGIGSIIHCAADTRFNEREDERIWNTNVSGAQNLVSAACRYAPAARVVFVSTASVVTAPERSCVDENAPYRGHANTYTRSKREAESIVLASPLDAVVLRPSIVLSRGVHDRAMARSILWAVPIMGEVGDVPVDPDARIDIVPVDYVARVIAQVALKPALRHGRYHISAGRGAHSFAELREVVIAETPSLSRIRPVGRRSQVPDRVRARLMRPLETYLPFINAGVSYSNDRIVEEFGDRILAPSSLSYVPGLVRQISLKEALAEMYQP